MKKSNRFMMLAASCFLLAGCGTISINSSQLSSLVESFDPTYSWPTSDPDMPSSEPNTTETNTRPQKIEPSLVDVFLYDSQDNKLSPSSDGEYYIAPQDNLKMQVILNNPCNYKIIFFGVYNSLQPNHIQALDGFEVGEDQNTFMFDVMGAGVVCDADIYLFDFYYRINDVDVKVKIKQDDIKEFKINFVSLYEPKVEDVISNTDYTSISYSYNLNDRNCLVTKEEVRLYQQDNNSLVATKVIENENRQIKFDDLKTSETYKIDILLTYDMNNINGRQVDKVVFTSKNIKTKDGLSFAQQFIKSNEIKIMWWNKVDAKLESSFIINKRTKQDETNDLGIINDNLYTIVSKLETRCDYQMTFVFTYGSNYQYKDVEKLDLSTKVKGNTRIGVNVDKVGFDRVSYSCDFIDIIEGQLVDFTKIDLIDGDQIVATLEKRAWHFDNLLSNHNYQLKAYGKIKQDGKTYYEVYGENSFKTPAKRAPIINVAKIDVSETSATLTLSDVNDDLVNYEVNVEVYYGDIKVKDASKINATTFSVEELKFETTYSFKIIAKYDLGDGQGEQSSVITRKFTTLKLSAPTIELTFDNLSPTSFALHPVINDKSKAVTHSEIKVVNKANNELFNAYQVSDEVIVSDLVIGNNYKATLEVEYSLDGVTTLSLTKTVELNTKYNRKPEFRLDYANVTRTSVDIKTNLTDYDSCLLSYQYEIGLQDKQERIIEKNINKKTFTNLTPARVYDLYVTFTYQFAEGIVKNDFEKVSFMTEFTEPEILEVTTRQNYYLSGMIISGQISLNNPDNVRFTHFEYSGKMYEVDTVNREEIPNIVYFRLPYSAYKLEQGNVEMNIESLIVKGHYRIRLHPWNIVSKPYVFQRVDVEDIYNDATGDKTFKLGKNTFRVIIKNPNSTNIYGITMSDSGVINLSFKEAMLNGFEAYTFNMNIEPYRISEGNILKLKVEEINHLNGERDFKSYCDEVFNLHCNEKAFADVGTLQEFETAIAKGDNIKLVNDIDLTNAKGNYDLYEQILDGNHHVLSNFTFSGHSALSGSLFQDVQNSKVHDLKIDNFNVDCLKNYAGTLAGFAACSTFENIDVTNSSVTSLEHAGGILGFVDNCSMINCYSYNNKIVGDLPAGGIAGECYNIEVLLERCHAKHNIITSKDSSGGLLGKADESVVIIQCLSEDNIFTGEAMYIGGFVGTFLSTTNNKIYNSVLVGITVLDNDLSSGVGLICGHGENIYGSQIAVYLLNKNRNILKTVGDCNDKSNITVFFMDRIGDEKIDFEEEMYVDPNDAKQIRFAVGLNTIWWHIDKYNDYNQIIPLL